MNSVVLNPVGSRYCSWLRYVGIDDAMYHAVWSRVAWPSPTFDGGDGIPESIREEVRTS